MSHVRNPYNGDPCNPYDVPLPPGVEGDLPPKKQARVTEIQLEHARLVTQSLADAYSEILAVIREPEA